MRAASEVLKGPMHASSSTVPSPGPSGSPGSSSEPEPEPHPPSPARGSDFSSCPGAGDAEGVTFIVDSDVVAPIDAVWLRGRIAAVQSLLERESARLEIRFVSDREMIRQHARHLGEPTTTDVITFNLSEDDEPDGSARGPRPIEAALIVCVDEAARQARERGHALEAELLLYVVHGLLHCLGHDDHDDAGFARMHAEEDRLLRAVGVGAIFAREGGPDDDARGEARS